jgi:rubredoxin
MHGRRPAWAYAAAVDKPSTCPECGSEEIRETTRPIGIYGDVTAFVCGACDWASDPRIGRPPADRSKNVTLRRLIDDRERSAGGDRP